MQFCVYIIKRSNFEITHPCYHSLVTQMRQIKHGKCLAGYGLHQRNLDRVCTKTRRSRDVSRYRDETAKFRLDVLSRWIYDFAARLGLDFEISKFRLVQGETTRRSRDLETISKSRFKISRRDGLSKKLIYPSILYSNYRSFQALSSYQKRSKSGWPFLSKS